MKININVMTKNRVDALKEVIAALALLDTSELEVCTRVFDSSDEKNYIFNKKNLNDYKNIGHIRLAPDNSMGVNWEYALINSDGNFIVTITDRSVVHKDMLKKIAEVLKKSIDIDALSWGWDCENNRTVYQLPYNSDDLVALSERDYLNSIAFYGVGKYPYHLPRGLNTLLKRETAYRIRNTFGNVYSGINPDYVLAFKLMLLNCKVRFLPKALFTSKFTSLSNGGISSKELNWNYLKSITNSEQIMRTTHMELPLCTNTIFADMMFIIDQMKVNGESILKIKRKIAYSSTTAIDMELKRFYGKKIINKGEYINQLMLNSRNRARYQATPDTLRIFLYRWVVKALPAFIFQE